MHGSANLRIKVLIFSVPRNLLVWADIFSFLFMLFFCNSCYFSIFLGGFQEIFRGLEFDFWGVLWRSLVYFFELSAWYLGLNV